MTTLTKKHEEELFLDGVYYIQTSNNQQELKLAGKWINESISCKEELSELKLLYIAKSFLLKRKRSR